MKSAVVHSILRPRFVVIETQKLVRDFLVCIYVQHVIDVGTFATRHAEHATDACGHTIHILDPFRIAFPENASERMYHSYFIVV